MNEKELSSLGSQEHLFTSFFWSNDNRVENEYCLTYSKIYAYLRSLTPHLHIENIINTILELN